MKLSPRALSALRPAAEPIVGAAWGTLWLIAEVGRGPQIAYPLILITLAIATSRLRPRLSIGFTAALLVIQLVGPSLRFTETSWPAYFGLAIVACELGALADVRLRRLTLTFTAGGAIVIGLLQSIPQFDPPIYGIVSQGDLLNYTGFEFIAAVTVAIAIVAIGAWFIGYGLRTWLGRAALEHRQLVTETELAEAELELRITTERDRIAQDVHDIMAHSLSVIIAQADGARYLGEIRPESTTASLAAISQSARQSLVEVRMLIDSLGSEPEGHSNPTLDEIPALTERMRSAGLAVESSTFGEPAPLTPGQELAVYRIVQESLTNALKHGDREPSATVGFDWRGPGLALTISSRGARTEQVAADGSPARGIRGMTERARLAGGWLSAGPDREEDDDDVFIVTAFIPVVDLSGGVAFSGSRVDQGVQEILQ